MGSVPYKSAQRLYVGLPRLEADNVLFQMVTVSASCSPPSEYRNNHSTYTVTFVVGGNSFDQNLLFFVIFRMS